MNDALVSSRVPSVKKERAARILAELGATTSDLINSAFDYLISTGKLPSAESEKTPKLEDFERFVNASTMKIDWMDFDTATDPFYKNAVADGKSEEYEASFRH